MCDIDYIRVYNRSITLIIYLRWRCGSGSILGMIALQERVSVELVTKAYGFGHYPGDIVGITV